MDGTQLENEDRKAWLSLLAKAPHAQLEKLTGPFVDGLAFDWLRTPEIGAVMVRGRAGSTGAAFNLGEMTVTRASARLASGEVGHGYVQGRSKAAAKAAALVDALMQTSRAAEIRSKVLTPLQISMTEAKSARAAKAAATKVEFFTMVRGDNE